MHACIIACVYVRVQLCMHVYVCHCVYMYVHEHAVVHVMYVWVPCVHVCMHMGELRAVCACICVCVCACICVCVHMYVREYSMYVCTCLYVCGCELVSFPGRLPLPSSIRDL